MKEETNAHMVKLYKNFICAIIENAIRDFINRDNVSVENFTNWVRTSEYFNYVDLNREYIIEQAIKKREKRLNEKENKETYN